MILDRQQIAPSVTIYSDCSRYIGVGHIWTKRLFTSMALWTITMRRPNWVGLHLNKFSVY